MKILVSQIYIEAGVEYPFSVHFQRFLSKELTELAGASNEFHRLYGDDFDLVFNVSAKSGIAEPEIRGPTVFKKNKWVEFTVFLTRNTAEPYGKDLYRQVLMQLLRGIIDVLIDLGTDVSQLSQNAHAIVERIVGDPKMVDLS